MKFFRNYLKKEFVEDDFLFFLNVIFMILIIPFFLFQLIEYKILNNYKGVIAIIIASFVFTYISFEVNCRIINFVNYSRLKSRAFKTIK